MEEEHVMQKPHNALMTHLHFRKRTQIQIPNSMVTLYYVEHVHIAQTRIPTAYFCVGQESESNTSLTVQMSH